MTLVRTAVIVTALLALGACAAQPSATPAQPSAPPAPSASPSTAAPSASAPMTADSLKFTSATIDGKSFDGASLAGKPAVLWFWASWCSKCRAKAPQLAAVQRDFGSKVNVVGVAGLRSGGEAMRSFAQDTGISGFPHLADDAGVVWKKFGVASQEYFVLIDSTGQVVHKGPLTGEQLRERVTALAG